MAAQSPVLGKKTGGKDVDAPVQPSGVTWGHLSGLSTVSAKGGHWGNLRLASPTSTKAPAASYDTGGPWEGRGSEARGCRRWVLRNGELGSTREQGLGAVASEE